MGRSALHEQGTPMFVAFGGSDELRGALEWSAQRYRGKTIFMFISEQEEKSTLKAIGRSAEPDAEYTGEVSMQAVYEWVKEIHDAIQIKDLESKSENLKVKKEELEKTLEDATVRADAKSAEVNKEKEELEAKK